MIELKGCYFKWHTMTFKHVMIFLVVLVNDCLGRNEFSFQPAFSREQFWNCGLEHGKEKWEMFGTLTLEDSSLYKPYVTIKIPDSPFVICNIDLRRCGQSSLGFFDPIWNESWTSVGKPSKCDFGEFESEKSNKSGRVCECHDSWLDPEGNAVFSLEVSARADVAHGQREVRGSIQSCDPRLGALETNNPAQTLPLIYMLVKYFGREKVPLADQNGLTKDVSRYCANDPRDKPLIQEVCRQPADAGHSDCGKAGGSRWFYDADSLTCTQFTYRGCGGNSNNFLSRQACEQRCPGCFDAPLYNCYKSTCDREYRERYCKKKCGTCVDKQNPDTGHVCHQPKRVGPCNAKIPRWFYNGRWQTCQQFSYGGCGGNENNFESLEQCQLQCWQKEPPKQYFIKKCMNDERKTFISGEFFRHDCNDCLCKGGHAHCIHSANVFCRSSGPDTQEIAPTPECHVPRRPCFQDYDQKHHWGFDLKTRSCGLRNGKGCSINEFPTKEKCEEKCLIIEKDFHGLNEFRFNQISAYRQFRACGLEHNKEYWEMDGTLTLKNPSLYKQHVTIGLSASSYEICKIDLRKCGTSASKPSNCDSGEEADNAHPNCWCYSSLVDARGHAVYKLKVSVAADVRMSQLEVKGSIESCNPRLGAIQKNISPPKLPLIYKSYCANDQKAKPMIKETCQQPALAGHSCKKYQQPVQGRWRYDTDTRKCTQFTYIGCGGNSNNFHSKQACEYLCSDRNQHPEIDVHTPVCKRPMRVGPCTAHLPRWFFDSATQTCQRFFYGGCGSNENNFMSLDDCQLQCQTNDWNIHAQRRFFIEKCLNDDGEKFDTGDFFGNDCNRCRCEEGGHATCIRRLSKDLCRSYGPGTQQPVHNPECYVPWLHCFSYERGQQFWQYELKDRVCMRVYDGGCKHNANSFPSKEKCEKKCLLPGEVAKPDTSW